MCRFYLLFLIIISQNITFKSGGIKGKLNYNLSLVIIIKKSFYIEKFWGIVRQTSYSILYIYIVKVREI